MIRPSPSLLIALLTTLLTAPATARTFEGVTLPDTAELGGQTLVLNGMGLREKMFIDVYVAGLYLAARTRDARAAITADTPKRIALVFKRSIDRKKLADSLRDALEGRSATVTSKGDTLAGWMEDVDAGDRVDLDYVPGAGTTVRVKGKAKGTIPGAAFMKAVWGIYLGRTPPTADLKKGLLGR